VSDELKAAIDRQRRYMGGENGYRVYFPEFVGRNHNWTDAEESEYVRRKRRDKERFGVWGHEAAWSMYLLNADGFDGQEEHVTAVRTRGQLRRLCAALGITLTQEQQ
jgi:hypothetical protein